MAVLIWLLEGWVQGSCRRGEAMALTCPLPTLLAFPSELCWREDPWGLDPDL